MHDPDTLTHLIKLLDDPSPTVQSAVKEALIAFGPGLDAALDALTDQPTKSQRETIASLVKAVSPSVGPRFCPGQLVRHRRYGYRGVVVDVDETCQADEAWYQRNRTQPDRNQPWYHVLADGTDQAFYPAESSLVEDDSDAEIDHPLVSEFFSTFEEGRYIRNEQEWGPG